MDCRNVSLSELSGIAWLSRLQQMGRHGQWQTILESLQQLPNDVAPEVAYSMAIISCGRCLQWQFSFELVKALQARKKEEAATYSAMAPVFIPNIVVVGSTLSVLSKASKWQQANAILPWLRQTRVQANAMAYNSAMTSFTSASRWQVATCLLSRGNVDTVQADVVSYTLLINNCEQTTQWQSGMALLQQLCCCIQPDGIVYNAAINACSKGAQWRTSETLLRELSRAELQMETVSFNTLASACEKGSAMERCSAHDDQSGELEHRSRCFLSFSVALKASRNTSSRGKWQVCWTLLDKIQRDQVQPEWCVAECCPDWNCRAVAVCPYVPEHSARSSRHPCIQFCIEYKWESYLLDRCTGNSPHYEGARYSARSRILHFTHQGVYVWKLAICRESAGRVSFPRAPGRCCCLHCGNQSLRFGWWMETSFVAFRQISKVENFKLISLHTMISLVHAPKVLGSNLNRSYASTADSGSPNQNGPLWMRCFQLLVSGRKCKNI